MATVTFVARVIEVTPVLDNGGNKTKEIVSLRSVPGEDEKAGGRCVLHVGNASSFGALTVGAEVIVAVGAATELPAPDLAEAIELKTVGLVLDMHGVPTELENGRRATESERVAHALQSLSSGAPAVAATGSGAEDATTTSATPIDAAGSAQDGNADGARADAPEPAAAVSTSS